MLFFRRKVGAASLAPLVERHGDELPAPAAPESAALPLRERERGVFAAAAEPEAASAAALRPGKRRLPPPA
jgi:hypothetical protein